MIERTLYLHQLYDLYNELLTDKQREYFELYYLEDLSLQEVSENIGVSRNAIHRQVKAVEKLLEKYEEKLNLNKKRIEMNEVLNQLKDLNVDEEIIHKIEDIM